MDGLGRVFNTIPVADGVLVPLKDASAVSFICYLAAGDTFTVQEAQDAAGTGAADLDVVDHYYTSDGVGGVWTERTQTADAAVTIAGTAGLDAAVFTINASSLSDGFTHVKCTSTSTGTVTAVLHDLTVQRAPQNLPALV
ncbi:hypothetical protein GLX30_30420 [Streptomyces sp. Tu 2975]|uniref:hypothetical protein n=1 Tax=Streptomyces sp. Tu 2975 TaxID=2676871 RepID=UPI0013592F2F|nr:hypothetical protein [Streptomyces sp. Tu 2975]QIP87630.1 hypothetical protein GLX30_30420 [Streptomyces sp. Tu 2975]